MDTRSRYLRFRVASASNGVIELPKEQPLPDGPLDVTVAPATAMAVPSEATRDLRRFILGHQASIWTIVDDGADHGFPPNNRIASVTTVARALDADGKLLSTTILGDLDVEFVESIDHDGKLSLSHVKKERRFWALGVPQAAKSVEIVSSAGERIARLDVPSPSAEVGPADGALPFPVTLVFGPADRSVKRFDLVFVSERFSADQLPQFAARCQEFVDVLGRQPWWNVHLDAIRVWRVDLPATEPGFDATIPDGKRQIVYNACKLREFVKQRLSSWSVAILLLNEDQAAATAVPAHRSVAVALPAVLTGASGNPEWFEYLFHELGHASFGLGDEYDYVESPDEDASVRLPFYAVDGSNLAERNVTDSLFEGELKWAALARFSAEHPLLDRKYTDCDECGLRWRQPLPVGLFEGAWYRRTGVFRPAATCRMRELHEPFCRVCAQAMHDKLRNFHAGPRLASEIREIAFGPLLKLHRWTHSFGISNVGAQPALNVSCRVLNTESETPHSAFKAELVGDPAEVRPGDWRTVRVTAGSSAQPGHQTGRLRIDSDTSPTIEIPICASFRNFSPVQ